VNMTGQADCAVVTCLRVTRSVLRHASDPVAATITCSARHYGTTITPAGCCPRTVRSMTGIKLWQIKPGSTIIRGRVAPQFGHGPQFSGGEEQIFVLQP